MRRRISVDTVTIGTGPVSLDVERCRKLGMTPDEIEDAAAMVHALGVLVQRPAFRRIEKADPGRIRPLNDGCDFCTDVEDTKG